MGNDDWSTPPDSRWILARLLRRGSIVTAEGAAPFLIVPLDPVLLRDVEIAAGDAVEGPPDT